MNYKHVYSSLVRNVANSIVIAAPCFVRTFLLLRVCSVYFNTFCEQCRVFYCLIIEEFTGLPSPGDNSQKELIREFYNALPTRRF